jgi:hypothetical protein
MALMESPLTSCLEDILVSYKKSRFCVDFMQVDLADCVAQEEVENNF